MMRNRLRFGSLWPLAFGFILFSLLLLPLSPAARGQDGGPGDGPNPLIDIGQRVTGTLRDASAGEAYDFAGQQGLVVAISVSSQAIDPVVELRDERGMLVARDDDSGRATAALLLVELPDSGRYTIIVRSFEDVKTGAFTLSLTQVNVDAIITPDTLVSGQFAPAPEAATEGQPVDDTGLSDRQFFSFLAEPESVVTLRLRSDDFVPQVFLFGPNGPLVEGELNADFNTSLIDAVYLREGGVYVAAVRGRDPNPVGSFALEYTENDPILPQPISYGTSALAIYNDQPVGWQFRGAAGDVVSIMMASRYVDGILELLGPGNRLIARTNDVGITGKFDPALFLPLPVDGVYTIAVRVEEAQDTAIPGQPVDLPERGTYRLSLELVDPAPELAPGEPLTGVLLGEVAVVTLEAVAGELYTVTASSDDFDPIMQLFWVNGWLATSDDGTAQGTTAQLSNVRIPADGVYVAAIYPFGNETEGNFTVLVERAEVRPPGQIDIGQTVVSTLDGRATGWLFEGQAGDLVRIEMQSDRFDPMLELRAPDASLIAIDHDAGPGLDALLVSPLPIDGDYTIITRNPANDAVGDFTLSVQPFSRERIVEFGQTRTGSLPDDGYGVYVFEGYAGQHITVSAQAAGFDAVIEVRAPDGTLATGDSAGAGQAEVLPDYELPLGGVYTLIVRSFHPPPPDPLAREYTFSLADVTAQFGPTPTSPGPAGPPPDAEREGPAPGESPPPASPTVMPTMTPTATITPPGPAGPTPTITPQGGS